MSFICIETFMDACRDFEAAVKLKYHLEDSSSAYMFIAGEFAKYRDEIHVIRTLRNMLAHNNMEIDGEEILHFSPLLLSTLKRITNEIISPTLVKDCMIKNVYTSDGYEKVEAIVQKMKEKGISHVPILDENRRLLGVFSNSTLFMKMSTEKTNCIGDEDILLSYGKYLPIDKHENEAFAFISCEDDIEKAKSLFKRTRANKKRCVMLFVTKNGQVDEAVIGILTPWDVME